MLTYSLLLYETSPSSLCTAINHLNLTWYIVCDPCNISTGVPQHLIGNWLCLANHCCQLARGWYQKSCVFCCYIRTDLERSIGNKTFPSSWQKSAFAGQGLVSGRKFKTFKNMHHETGDDSWFSNSPRMHPLYTGLRCAPRTDYGFALDNYLLNNRNNSGSEARLWTSSCQASALTTRLDTKGLSCFFLLCLHVSCIFSCPEDQLQQKTWKLPKDHSII